MKINDIKNNYQGQLIYEVSIVNLLEEKRFFYTSKNEAIRKANKLKKEYGYYVVFVVEMYWDNNYKNYYYFRNKEGDIIHRILEL